MRFNPNAIIRENRKRGGVLNQAHIRGAQRQRKIRRQRGSNAEPLGHIYNLLDADLFGNFDGGDISGTVEGAPQCDDSLEMSIVILRRVVLASAYRGVGRVENGVKRAVTLLQRRGININLE